MSGAGFLVRSPALPGLVADGTAAGVPLGEMLDLADTLYRELTSLADMLAGLIAERLLPSLEARRSISHSSCPAVR
jgi:hypothetical protein